MIQINQIAGVIVLYYPDLTVLENITATAHQVDRLYIIDNSEKINHDLIRRLSAFHNLIYISNKKNLGISTALNIIARKAFDSGYRYLLTLDQDSTPEPDMVNTMITSEPALKFHDVGLLSPFHKTGITPVPPRGKAFEEVLVAWTSGSIVNLNVFQKAGPFDENLFIDYVDYDYCLSLALAGYKTYKIYAATLDHEIGNNVAYHRFLCFKLITSNHSAIRKYYITRNRLYLFKKYKFQFPLFFLSVFKAMVGECMGILLFENDKSQKFKMIIRGFRDFTLNRLGELK